jgi:hypothetical protein
LDWLQSRYGDLVMAVVVPEFERVSLPIRDCHPGAGASVIVSYDTSAGLDIDEVRLDEDDIHVRITLYAHVPPWTDSFKADRRSKKTTIQLARPVGGRSVQIG